MFSMSEIARKAKTPIIILSKIKFKYGNLRLDLASR